MGIRASSTASVSFADVRVPAENVLGEVGKGYKIAIETLNEGRIGIGAQMVGLAQGAYEAALAYTKERKQFGQMISEFQGVQFPLAGAQEEFRVGQTVQTELETLREEDGGQEVVIVRFRPVGSAR